MGFLAVFQPYFDSVQPYLDQFGPYPQIAGKFLYENMGGACFNDLSSCFPPPPTDFCSAVSSVSFGAGIVGIALGGRGSPLGFGAFLASRIARMVEAHYCFRGAELNSNEMVSLAGLAYMKLSGSTATQTSLAVAESTRQATVKNINDFFLTGLKDPISFKEMKDTIFKERTGLVTDVQPGGQFWLIGQIIKKVEQLWFVSYGPEARLPSGLHKITYDGDEINGSYWNRKIESPAFRYPAWRAMTTTMLWFLSIATLLEEQRAANAAYQKINASLAKPSNEAQKTSSFFKRLFG